MNIKEGMLFYFTLLIIPNYLPIPAAFPHLLLHLLVVQTNLSEIFHLPMNKGQNYDSGNSV
jgi:hypothetical protein